MRQIIIAIISVLLAGSAIAQSSATMDAEMQKELKAMRAAKPMIGLKAGYNIAKLSGSSASFNPDPKSGFMVAGSYAPANRGGLGFRSEVVFSRQGFAFDDNGKNIFVTNDYIYLPQFTTFGITKFVQLQAGGQIGYLLKSSQQTGAEADKTDITSIANRLDYGAAFGAEIYPVRNLILGGRYNISLGDGYKQKSADVSIQPFPLPFNPSEVKGKNAVINLYVGFRF